MGFLGALRNFLSASRNRADQPKPFLMKVRIVGHSFRCGYNIDEDGQYVTTVAPIDEEMRALYGEQFDVYSQAVQKGYDIGSEITLPFFINPLYRPEIIGDSPLIVYTNHLE